MALESGTTRHVALIPQPSDDPRDPLVSRLCLINILGRSHTILEAKIKVLELVNASKSFIVRDLVSGSIHWSCLNFGSREWAGRSISCLWRYAHSYELFGNTPSYEPFTYAVQNIEHSFLIESRSAQV